MRIIRIKDCLLFFFIAMKKEKQTEKKNTLFTTMPLALFRFSDISSERMYVFVLTDKNQSGA
jgi:hypothetical protein